MNIGGEHRSPTRAFERKYRDELRRLSLYWPSESVSLEEALAGRLEIRLHSGALYRFSREEVEKLAELAPSYIHSKLMLPLLLRYQLVGAVSFYIVLGDRWQRRLAELMLHGRYSYEGLDRLRVSEFQRIIARYPSLVFVSLSI